MTKYLPFPTPQAAEARNRQIARRLGCGRNPEDVTREWFSVLEKRGPADEQDNSKDVAFVVPDDEYPLLDLEEANGHGYLKTHEAKAMPVNPQTVEKLKTDAQLKADGWHPFKDVPNVELEAPPIVMGMGISSQWTWDNAIKPMMKAINL